MTASPKPRLAVFDCDGTLVDSQHSIIGAMTARGGFGDLTAGAVIISCCGDALRRSRGIALLTGEINRARRRREGPLLRRARGAWVEGGGLIESKDFALSLILRILTALRRPSAPGGERLEGFVCPCLTYLPMPDWGALHNGLDSARLPP